MHTVAQVPQQALPTAAAKEMARPVESPVASSGTVAKGIPSNSAGNDKSIWWWVGFFAVFVLWGWVQNREKISTELRPRNIQANLHNLTIITFAAVIGIIGGQVLFTKLAAMTAKIPGLRKVTGYLAQLFSAA